MQQPKLSPNQSPSHHSTQQPTSMAPDAAAALVSRTRKSTANLAHCETFVAWTDLPQEHDTDSVAKYKELSQCSDGKLWQYSNVDDIGRMFQGLGPDSYMPTGTETLWFIARKNIPKHK
jgi:hypothetical protein